MICLNILYEYAVEMICDQVAAGLIYKGKDWTKENPIKYWNEIENNRHLYNPKTEKFITVIKEEIAEKGINEVINKKYLKEIFNKYCE